MAQFRKRQTGKRKTQNAKRKTKTQNAKRKTGNGKRKTGMATRHSRTVGGSSAGRLLNCPASLKEIMNLPQAIETTSEYAEEGTHLHDVSAMLMTTRMRQPKADLKKLAALHVGKVFHDRPFTRDLLDSCIEPALDHLAELERLYGGGFKVVGVETEVRFPGIPDGFGTADIFLQSRKYL